MPIFYSAADIFVLLTHSIAKSEESFGTVFLEASTMRVPVIAGKVGGVEEAVKSGLTGFVVDTTNSELVVSTIVDLLKNKTYATELGQHAYDRVLKEFTWEKQINKFLL